MGIHNFVVIASCVALAKATVFVKAPCPDVKPVDNFNWTAYKGVWYEVARYPDDWEKQGDCGIMEYDLNSPNKFNLSNVVNQKRVSITGSVIVDNGVLRHDSSNFKKIEGTSVIPVNIIAVDYDNYAIVYECLYNDKTKIRHDYCWIMSRDRKKNSEVAKKAGDFVKSFGVIDTNKLVWSHLADDTCLL